MSAKPKAPKSPKNADPDKLAREQGGTYRSGGGRFEVRDGGTGWFVSDAEQTNDFGQELISGPYPTLKAAREALPSLRNAKVVPMRRRTATKTSKKKTARTQPATAPTAWIDELPTSEAAEVRRLIAALERAGITDAEALVRRDRDGLLPAVATRLIEQQLDALADELPEPAREGARQLIRRAAEIVTAGGANAPKGLPGWTLMETGPEPDPPNRRISIRA
ncbi:MAG: hypothetical protein ACR2I5_02795 [Candidatus Limnocylindria bacterium]